VTCTHDAVVRRHISDLRDPVFERWYCLTAGCGQEFVAVVPFGRLRTWWELRKARRELR
jgi:hypothetical protein